MTQIVDASVVVAALVDDGPDGRWCEDRLVEDDLAAPHLLPFEVANVLRRSETRGAIDRSTALHALADLQRLAVHLVAFEPLAERVWELRGHLTAYDAGYVATAERLGGRLVTLDRRLAHAPGLRCPVLTAP